MNFLMFIVGLVAASGGLAYGLDSGIIGTTLGQDTFKLYMFGPTMKNTALSGAVVSVYNAGQAIGSLTVGYLADKFSRKYTMSGAGFLAIVAGILQCAANGPEMFIVGRLIGGIACGQILSSVPIYLAEVAPPNRRGFLVGLQGMLISTGFGLANWVGYAGSFASGDARWRIPLAMQIPLPVFFAVAAIFVPFSPRWLVQQDRYDEARSVLLRLHMNSDNNLADQELVQIREQIRFEREVGSTSWGIAVKKLFSRQYIRRTVTAAFILAMGQLSGSSVIQNFQTIFYATVGFTGQTALLISGIFGMMGIFGQIFYLVVVADRWPRTRTLWTGSVTLSAIIAICMALSAVYGSTGGDQNGARAAIAFIFIYSICYSVFFNAMIWVVPSELFPFFLRTKGLAFAVFVKAVAAIVLSQITPLALAQISWRYYSLFIATNFTAAVIYFFCLPETGGKSLEEIAEVFGDKLACNHLGEIDVNDQKEGQAEEVNQVEIIQAAEKSQM